MTELEKENIKLTLFYSQLMQFLYRETSMLDISTMMRYKIVENEDFTKMIERNAEPTAFG